MISRFFKVNRRDIVYLKFILEAYEGMNFMSTVDNSAGIIRVSIMHGFEDEMNGLLKALSAEVIMEDVPEPV